jgi:hypothetical protein
MDIAIHSADRTLVSLVTSFPAHPATEAGLRVEIRNARNRTLTIVRSVEKGEGKSCGEQSFVTIEKMGNLMASDAQRAADATLASARSKEAYRHQKTKDDAAQAIVEQKNAMIALQKKMEDDAVRENTVKIKDAIRAWMKPANHERNASLDDALEASHLCYLELPNTWDACQRVLQRLRSQKFELIVSIGWSERERCYGAVVYQGCCPCFPSPCC